jgi:hypothetical protein
VTIQAIRTVDVPLTTGVEFAPASRHARRRALDALHALATLGEPWACRMVLADGSIVPPDQVTEQVVADVQSDLERLGTRDLLSLDALIEQLYAASSRHDRSAVAPALDRLLDYVDSWSPVSPERVAALFERLDPSRLVRAVGQTLLAATRLASRGSAARQAFLSRFLEDLRVRGTPEATIRRLEQGFEM